MPHREVSRRNLSKAIETLAQDPLNEQAERSSWDRENFPVASRFLPRRFRQPFRVIYAYCRGADNLADLITDPAAALEALNIWQEQLEAAFEGKAALPLFRRLQDLLPNYPLQKEPFTNLLIAFRRDQNRTIYQTREELLDYCNYSAVPVGRMLLQLMGKDEAIYYGPADALCIGLQLANFWQDLSRDRPRREYLPTEDLARFGLTRESLDYTPTPPALEKLIRYEVAQTVPYFHQARELKRMLSGRIGFEIELIRQSGLRILRKTSKWGALAFYKRPVFHRFDWFLVFLRTIF